MKCVLEQRSRRPFHGLSGGEGRRKGGEKPFMTYQPEKQKNTVLINVATKGSAAPVASFTLDKITEDFVQTEVTKFFTCVASETS